MGIASAVFIHQKSVSLVGAEALNTSAAAEENSMLEDPVLEKLHLLENSIDRYYLESVSKNDLEESLYHGFVAGLGDPYSTYYPKRNWKRSWKLMKAYISVSAPISALTMIRDIVK